MACGGGSTSGAFALVLVPGGKSCSHRAPRRTSARPGCCWPIGRKKPPSTPSTRIILKAAASRQREPHRDGRSPNERHPRMAKARKRKWTAKSHSNPRHRRSACRDFPAWCCSGAGGHAAGNGLDPKTCEADRNAPFGMDVSGCFAELTMLWFAESHSLLGYASGLQNSARLAADSSLRERCD
jgi:hypothetical protein